MSRANWDDRFNYRAEPAPLPRFSRSIGSDFASRSGRGTSSDNGNGGSSHAPIRHLQPERPRAQTLYDSELKVLTDIGTFRALSVSDLEKYRYGSDSASAKRNLRTLLESGLIQSRTSYPDRTVYVSLTRRGYRLLSNNPQEKQVGQRYYEGFVKTRDAQHDAALYRLYQQEVERIENDGGRVKRVILDFELKQSLNRRLATLGRLPQEEQAERRQEIAQEHGLKVVGGKIPLPDLRLEYEGPEQELSKVDLELVTNHYHRDHLASKSQAGFAMYALSEDAAHLRPAMQDREIMQDIVSL
jgi:DNA-binding MarR family transcriptional regulator